MLHIELAPAQLYLSGLFHFSWELPPLEWDQASLDSEERWRRILHCLWVKCFVFAQPASSNMRSLLFTVAQPRAKYKNRLLKKCADPEFRVVPHSLNKQTVPLSATDNWPSSLSLLRNAAPVEQAKQYIKVLPRVLKIALIALLTYFSRVR